MTDLIQAIVLGVLIGGTYALVGSGLSLIYGVMQIINFAQGALLVLAAYVTYSIWRATGLDPFAVLLITTPALFVLGWLMYMVLLRPVRDEYAGVAILLPFGVWLLLQGAEGLIWGANETAITPAYMNSTLHIGAIFVPEVQLFGLILAILVLIALSVFLSRTWAGRAVRAAAVNPASATLLGIRTSVVSAVAFGLGVAVTAAGGSIIGVLFPFVPGSGATWLIIMLAIVVVGGMGSIKGAVVAGLLLGLATAFTSRYVGVSWSTAVPYALVIVVLLVRPQGLFGKLMREDTAQ